MKKKLKSLLVGDRKFYCSFSAKTTLVLAEATGLRRKRSWQEKKKLKATGLDWDDKMPSNHSDGLKNNPRSSSTSCQTALEPPKGTIEAIREHRWNNKRVDGATQKRRQYLIQWGDCGLLVWEDEDTVAEVGLPMLLRYRVSNNFGLGVGLGGFHGWDARKHERVREMFAKAGLDYDQEFKEHPEWPQPGYSTRKSPHISLRKAVGSRSQTDQKVAAPLKRVVVAILDYRNVGFRSTRQWLVKWSGDGELTTWEGKEALLARGGNEILAGYLATKKTSVASGAEEDGHESIIRERFEANGLDNDLELKENGRKDIADTDDESVYEDAMDVDEDEYEGAAASFLKGLSGRL